MIRPDLLSESRLSLTQLAHKEKVGIATVWRWATNGIGGVRLESFRIGRKRFTTAEAFQRFIAKQNGGFIEAPAATPKQRREAIERAERELMQH